MSEVNNLPSAVQLVNDVKSAISDKETNVSIRDRVVKQLVEQEVSRRASLLASALDKRREADKELQKIKPDTTFFDPSSNNWSQPCFSKNAFETRKKAQEKLDKIDKAIDKAVNDADYSELEKLSKSGDTKSETD